MTIFGPDISSYQHGVNIAALTDPFVLLKATEGTYYTDADYGHWLAQAKTSGKLVIAYHFISGEDPNAQAEHLAAHIVDSALPVMLDWEPTNTYRPTFGQLLAVADALVRHGLRPKLAYVPAWYHAQVGKPSLAPLSARGMAVVSSAYPNPAAGYEASGGDEGEGWTPYGGLTPLLWQFTDVAVEGGQRVGDRNAFRGTVAQLAKFLGTPAPTQASPTSDPTPSGGTMGTIPPSISQRWPELAGDFPPNAPFTDESALVWGDAGARAAALFAQQARDAVNALAAKIATPPPLDVAALAAALAKLLPAGTPVDLEALARDVVAELGTALSHT